MGGGILARLHCAQDGDGVLAVLLELLELIGDLFLQVFLLLKVLSKQQGDQSLIHRRRMKGEITYVARHDLHQLISGSQISRSSTPKELVKFLHQNIHESQLLQKKKGDKGYRCLGLLVLLQQFFFRLEGLKKKEGEEGG